MGKQSKAEKIVHIREIQRKTDRMKGRIRKRHIEWR